MSDIEVWLGLNNIMAEKDDDMFMYETMAAPLGADEDFISVGEADDFARSPDNGRRSLQSLIAAEKDLMAAASPSVEFKARTDTSGSGDLDNRSEFSPQMNITMEENLEEADFIPLEITGDDEEEAEQSNGKRVESHEDASVGPTEAPPWARGRQSWIHSPLLQLHQEIVDFCEFVAPTEEEQQLRAAAVQRVTGVVKSIWPLCEVKVFGSFATGLYLPTSDVDVVVLDSGCQAIQDGLKALAKALTRGQVAKSIQVIGKAKVPIINFVETTSNVPFDISFDVSNGPEAAGFIKGALEAIPPLRPLVLVLKIFLQQRELNEVYQGGIGSYALLVMILTHLQMHPSKRRLGSRDQAPTLETNLGILLVDFLDLYGRTLYMKDVGISCQGGGRFFRKRDRGFYDSKRPFLLCVEDPQAPINDIGKNSYAIQKVRSAFMMAHRRLTNVDDDDDSEVGLLSRIVRMDAKLKDRKAAPLPLPDTPLSQPAKKARPATFGGYYHESNGEEDRYVFDDAKFSDHDSGDAIADFKTPERERGRRGRRQDYEEDDYPRVASADGYLYNRAKKAQYYKEKDSLFEHDKYKEKDSFFEHDKYKEKDSLFEHDKYKEKDSLFEHDKYKEKDSLFEHDKYKEKEHGRYKEKEHDRYKEKEHDRYKEKDPLYGHDRYKEKDSLYGHDRHKESRSEYSRKRAHHGDSEDAYRYARRSTTVAEGTEDLEEGEVRLSRRASKSQDREEIDEETSVGRGNGHNQHTHWDDDQETGSSRSSRKYSRFKVETASRKRDSSSSRQEADEYTRRIVVTKPAHKKIKYM